MPTGFATLTVARVDRLCDDAVAVEFDEAPGFDFVAGQSLTVRRTVDEVEHRRTYSLCSPEDAQPRIGVREVPGGTVSPWLVREVRPGDQVEAMAPSGRFALIEPKGSHLCVAAGSGITPILSIAATVLAAGGSVTLLYGNRGVDSVMFAEELSDLKDAHPSRFHLVHLLSREPRDPELFSGRIDAERLARLLTDIVPPRFDHAWLCGPWPMVEAAKEVLAAHGVSRERTHAELFFVDEPPPPPVRVQQSPATDSVEVQVVLEGRRTSTQVAPGTTVLDGVQATRADLPFACKGGVCGTCRAKLVEGEVEMRRNYALDPSELADGFVLTCQAVPTGARVTVDFDA
ncbi:2Fe-2S iron-sulfur cluster-binding protein [Nocardioides alcanivorans]|uniref:2Fe-2S iron-sulfur cluster-binding protein n=1 Tax=Nocardioides alcanivorans TaxID=2897352 RepID=UPI001F1A02E1|nr:2Fe-2S iron-sulfur cluster-binding protein [Nocardioides alcanivorans]